MEVVVNNLTVLNSILHFLCLNGLHKLESTVIACYLMVSKLVGIGLKMAYFIRICCLLTYHIPQLLL